MFEALKNQGLFFQVYLRLALRIMRNAGVFWPPNTARLFAFPTRRRFCLADIVRYLDHVFPGSTSASTYLPRLGFGDPMGESLP